ncbi:hypothetical protein ACQCQ4_20970, partial [Ralstonia pseudosolanacearum]
MKMHRFTGLTSRDVLRKVRDQLGDGALILSNRAIPGGIEVIAASDSHLDALIDTQSTAPRAAQRRPVMPAPACPACRALSSSTARWMGWKASRS